MNPKVYVVVNLGLDRDCEIYEVFTSLDEARKYVHKQMILDVDDDNFMIAERELK